MIHGIVAIVVVMCIHLGQTNIVHLVTFNVCEDSQ